MLVIFERLLLLESCSKGQDLFVFHVCHGAGNMMDFLVALNFSNKENILRGFYGSLYWYEEIEKNNIVYPGSALHRLKKHDE